MEQWQIFRKSKFAVWEVSDWGNIRKNGKPYTPFEKGGHEGNRYLTLSLNEPFGGYIHRIVAHTFLPNPEGLETVNHKDGDKHNNHVDNLEWTNYSTQITHSYDLGLNSRACESWDGRTEYQKYLDDRHEQVASLWDSGFTIKEIAQDVGISYQLARLDLIKLGLYESKQK